MERAILEAKDQGPDDMTEHVNEATVQPIDGIPAQDTLSEDQLRELTVYIVDDDEGARESLAALVESKGVRAEPFQSAEALLAYLDRVGAPAGCAVVDYRLAGGMSGLELLEEIRRRDLHLPAVVITAYGTVPVAVKALQRGALTLLEKPCAHEELWAAIQSALLAFVKQRDRSERIAEIRRRFERLTEGEVDVLRGMIAGKLNKMIARDLNLSVRTVETRRHNVHAKMEVGSLAELVRMVIEADLPLRSRREDG